MSKEIISFTICNFVFNNVLIVEGLIFKKELAADTDLNGFIGVIDELNKISFWSTPADWNKIVAGKFLIFI